MSEMNRGEQIKIDVTPSLFDTMKFISETVYDQRITQLDHADVIEVLRETVMSVDFGLRRTQGIMHIGGIVVANSHEDGEQAFRGSMNDKLDEIDRSRMPITLQVVEPYILFGLYRRKHPKVLSRFNFWPLTAGVE